MVQPRAAQAHTEQLQESQIQFASDPEEGTLTWRKAIERLCAAYRNTRKSDGSQLLIVDDDRDASASLADILHDRGYRVDVAHDGEEALKYLKQKPYRLAVLEMKLPVMDGIELFDRMRQQRSHNKLEAVIVTSSSDPETHRIAQTRGIRRVLSKPVNLGELLSLIQRYADEPVSV